MSGASRLVLWRHGRTEWNAQGRFQGQLDPPLDDVGRRQATTAAAGLVATFGLSADDGIIVSSDLSRAADTAAALGDLLGRPVTLDARLREHHLGSWQGLNRDEVAARHPEQFADWQAGRPVDGRGGEHPDDVAARAMDLVADLPPVRVAVLVGHGGVIGRLLAALLGLGPDQRRLLGPLDNGAWSELVPSGSGWRLLRHNVVSPTVGPAAVPAGSTEASPAQDADAVR